MNEYISLNHVTVSMDESDDSGYFLPHHCVVKETTTTTCLGVVSDESSETSADLSVNEFMFVINLGPCFLLYSAR